MGMTGWKIVIGGVLALLAVNVFLQARILDAIRQLKD